MTTAKTRRGGMMCECHFVDGRWTYCAEARRLRTACEGMVIAVREKAHWSLSEADVDRAFGAYERHLFDAVMDRVQATIRLIAEPYVAAIGEIADRIPGHAPES